MFMYRGGRPAFICLKGGGSHFLTTLFPEDELILHEMCHVSHRNKDRGSHICDNEYLVIYN